LVVSSILSWILWLTAWLITEQFVFDQQHSWKYHFFHAAWMAFFTMISFNWKELKAFFSRQHKKEQTVTNNGEKIIR
jgi:hypothetical protein